MVRCDTIRQDLVWQTSFERGIAMEKFYLILWGIGFNAFAILIGYLILLSFSWINLLCFSWLSSLK
jgi:hypothetical protein